MHNRMRTITRALLAANCLVLSSLAGMADELTAKFATPADAYKPK